MKVRPRGASYYFILLLGSTVLLQVVCESFQYNSLLMFSLGRSSLFHTTIRIQRILPQHRFFHCGLQLGSAKANNLDADSSEPGNSKKKRPKRAQKTFQNFTGKTYRADRVLANRGWGTRSECFDILKQRRVFQKTSATGDEMEANLQTVLGPSVKIPMDIDLWVDGKHQVPKPPPLLRVYHKPKWVLSVMTDKNGRKNLSDLNFIQKMHPVGRLDYDSSGLLLFCSDGTLTQTLLHPSNEIEKEYVALVVGTVQEDELRQTLAEGVTTSLGAFPAQLLSADAVPSEQVEPLIRDILDNLPPEYNLDKLEEKGYLSFKDAKELSKVRLVVEEGKHRMVRRILANSGFPVIGLKRERLGVIHLDELAEGGHRDLSEKEEQWAKALLKKKRQKS